MAKEKFCSVDVAQIEGDINCLIVIWKIKIRFVKENQPQTFLLVLQFSFMVMMTLKDFKEKEIISFNLFYINDK